MILNLSVLKKSNSNYVFFLLVSLVAHSLLFFTLNLENSNYQPKEQYKEVKIILEPEAKNSNKKVVVSPSDIQESKKNIDTNLISDKTTSVEKEQIKRGVPDTASAKVSTNHTAPTPKSQNASRTVKKTNKEQTQRLKPTVDKTKQTSAKNILATISDSTFAAFNKNHVENTDANNQSETKTQPDSNANETAESRLNSIAGISGNPDLLTGIQDGEITLLNAKADRFAVFVRRVALQVFSALRTSNWYEIGDLHSGFETQEVSIRAVLDKNGKFISYELLKSSKTDLFDRVLVQSVKKGAWDRNPPQSALAADGTIKFIFQSKAWVRGGVNGRSHQWILLSTGLE